jgi:F-type H+-transporting ATPase subunit O
VQRRSYAAAPPKGAKPPITIHTLEGTYASALYSSTGGNNATLGDIEKALNAIRKRLDSDAKLAGAVVNPAVSHQEKQDIVQLLSQIGGVGGEAGKAVKNLLLVMSENGRLGKWDGVQSAFERLMRAHKGEIDVVVTSAQVPSPTRPFDCLFSGLGLMGSRWIIVC